ncbi:MAG TPA: L-serine ammonia-lyase, iron-sulfur-dependent, subunit beta [Clostridiaceae bacterium]|nr:L-serine ammonia-lyase, iron-sulfur-dependent, subunit beta [Clostridiaceae bacterium]
MHVFDVIGPVMVGPSSSHTAGAVRIARVARIILQEEIKKAKVILHGSFAETYMGHGTDRAIIGGLMGFSTDDIRIRDSIKIAEEAGKEFNIETGFLGDVHPNTVLIEAEGMSGRVVSVLGSSIGGGNIAIKKINGVEVDFSGRYHILIIEHKDRPGAVAVVTGILGRNNTNIAIMKVYRSYKGGKAIMVIETDQSVDEGIINEIKGQPNILDVTSINLI